MTWHGFESLVSSQVEDMKESAWCKSQTYLYPDSGGVQWLCDYAHGSDGFLRGVRLKSGLRLHDFIYDVALL